MAFMQSFLIFQNISGCSQFPCMICRALLLFCWDFDNFEKCATLNATDIFLNPTLSTFCNASVRSVFLFFIFWQLYENFDPNCVTSEDIVQREFC